MQVCVIILAPVRLDTSLAMLFATLCAMGTAMAAGTTTGAGMGIEAGMDTQAGAIAIATGLAESSIAIAPFVATTAKFRNGK